MVKKKGLFVLVLLVLSLLGNAFFLFKNSTSVNKGGLGAPIPPPIAAQRVKVARVIDGDTFDTDQQVRIRLRGIDAPEYPTACISEQAKDRLEQLILNKEVSLSQKSIGKFNRTIAYVHKDGLLIDEALVEEGLARATRIDNDQYGVVIASAQDRAKAAERGIWSSLCLNPNPDCVIKGNFREDKDTKIYHSPDCYNYDKINLRLDKKDQWFCTEAEAKEAGFRKSRDCPGYK